MARVTPLMRRFSRPEPSLLPEHLWAEMDRARALGDDLARAGHAIRFVPPAHAGARVRVELRDRDDRVVRELSLGDIWSL